MTLRAKLGAVALCAVAVLPWVFYADGGPSVTVARWALALVCSGVLLFTWPHGRPLLRASVLVAALCTCVLGLVQYLGGAAHLAPWVSPANAGLFLGNLRQPNQAATLMNMGLAVVLLGAVRARTWHPSGHSAALTATALLALGVSLTGSRTGMLQLGMVFAAIAWWGRRGPRSGAGRWHLPLALCAFVCGAVVMPWFIDAEPLGRTAVSRMLEASEACSSRLVLWSNVLDLVAQRPWLGWGWGELDYAHYITPYVGPRFCDILDNAHNLPLQLAVELGLPAATLLCGGALVLAVRAKPWRAQHPTAQLAWGVLLVIGLHSLLEYPLWYGPFQVAALLAVGMLCTPQRLQGSGLQRNGLRLVACGLAGALIAITAFTGWEYSRVSQLYIHPQARSPELKDNTYEKVKDAVLFRSAVQFAYVTTTPVTPETARALYTAALQTMHYSPEPRVIEVLLESAAMLGLESPLTAHIRERGQVVYPPR